MNIYGKITILYLLLVIISSVILISIIYQYLPGDGRMTTPLIIAFVSITVLALAFAMVTSKILIRPLADLGKIAEEQMEKGNLDGEQGQSEDGADLAQQLRTAFKRIEEQKELNQKLEDQKSEIEEQKRKLEEVNKQVVDSISYAQRIQRSILPEMDSFSKVIADSFVLYKPKDVVSGDFYWLERVRQGRHEYLIVVCADCTGHGVPGAIMSIMGSNQLTNIIYYQNYLDPRKILARMDKVIKFELRQDKNDSRNPDGMEIGICVIDLDDLSMEFAGVGIPLYLVKKSGDDKKKRELIAFKSPKLMIGGIDGDEKAAEEQLIKESIKLEEGDRIYLASDGFQDQFGGPDDKKFMNKNLRKILEQTATKKMKEQQKELEKKFEEWRKNTPQTDDVLVIGIEV